jgi:hypothetical protein
VAVETHTFAGRSAISACEVFERTARCYPRPAFGITNTKIGDCFLVWQSPFCRLLHFKRESTSAQECNKARALLRLRRPRARSGSRAPFDAEGLIARGVHCLSSQCATAKNCGGGSPLAGNSGGSNGGNGTAGSTCTAATPVFTFANKYRPVVRLADAL